MLGRELGRGPREFDIHSSHKAWIDSPVWRLIQALATMTTRDGNRSLVEGFYDDVKPWPEDLALIDKLAESFDEEPTRRMLKVDHFIDDAKGRDLIYRYLYSPTFNVSGIWGGWTGPETKTILPHAASVKLDCRLVPDMDPDRVVAQVRRHLDEHGYPDIEVRLLHKNHWAKARLSNPLAQATLKTCRDFGSDPEIWPHSAGGVGAHWRFQRILGVSMVGGGLGTGGLAHSPNEYFVVEGEHTSLAKCEKFYAAVLENYSKI